MDPGGFGSQTTAEAPLIRTPRRVPESRPWVLWRHLGGMLTLQALASSLKIAGRAAKRDRPWAEERLLGAISGSLSPKTAASILRHYRVFFLRALLCTLEILEFPGEWVNLQESAVFCETDWVLRSPLRGLPVVQGALQLPFDF